MILRVRNRSAGLLAGLALLILLGGCSTYVDRHAMLRADLADGAFDKALAGIEKGSRGKDRLLNLLEQGLVLHYADRWEESNAVFAEAEQLAADLYTKSISEGVFSLVSNDNSISYRATPNEMAMVPYFRALNYVYLGQRDGALVEARKAGLLLGEIRSRIESDEAEALDQNAFLAYFAGLIFEWGGELNDAFIAYRAAAEAYAAAAGELSQATPPWLGADLARTGARLGFAEQLAEIRQGHPDLLPEETPPPTTGRGEVVLLLELGYAPMKVSRPIDIPIFADDDYDDRNVWATDLHGRAIHGWSSGADIEYWLRIAVPELVDHPPAVAGANVSAEVGASHARTVVVSDVAGRVGHEFDHALGGVMIKTIARGLAKYALTEKAENESALAGFLANIFGAATEQADTRSWLTLPHEVAMARLSLPPGVHDLRVELIDAAGRPVGSEMIEGVAVRAGGRVFLSRRVF